MLHNNNVMRVLYPPKFCPALVNEIPLFSTICPEIFSRQVDMYDIYTSLQQQPLTTPIHGYHSHRFHPLATPTSC